MSFELKNLRVYVRCKHQKHFYRETKIIDVWNRNKGMR